MPSFPPAPELSQLLDDLHPSKEGRWAVDNYKKTVEFIVSNCRSKKLIEIGGGRHPLFSADDLKRLGADLTLNDISCDELDRAPSTFSKLCFDVACDTLPPEVPRETFDFAFSRMVFEHIRDTQKAWANMYKLLAKGGIAFAFYPTLYSLPFVVNKLLPESLSTKILMHFDPRRTADGIPKFPAYYDECYGDERKISEMIINTGFRKVVVLPFYGHYYFAGIPLVRTIDDAINTAAQKHNWTFLTSYAYAFAQK